MYRDEPPPPRLDTDELQGMVGDIESAIEEGCANANDAFNKLYYALRDSRGDADEIAHYEKDLDDLFEHFFDKLSALTQELRDDIGGADGSRNPFSRNFDGY